MWVNLQHHPCWRYWLHANVLWFKLGNNIFCIMNRQLTWTLKFFLVLRNRITLFCFRIKRGFVTLYERITYVENTIYERSTWIESILDVLWWIIVNMTHKCFALMWLRDHSPYIVWGFSHIAIHIIMSSIWKVGSVKRPFISKSNRDIKNSNRLTWPT